MPSSVSNQSPFFYRLENRESLNKVCSGDSGVGAGVCVYVCGPFVFTGFAALKGEEVFFVPTPDSQGYSGSSFE